MSERTAKSQAKAFQKWANFQLTSTNRRCNDMSQDWRDGTLLIDLLKQVTDCKVNGKRYRFNYRKHPRNEFECMDNIQVALNYLEDKGITLVNVGPGDIYKGDMKLTLGLIWTIISAFQIDAKEHAEEAAELDLQPAQPGLPAPIPAKKASSGSEHLLHWCQSSVAPYEGMGVTVKNFHRSFQDGMALAALIHRYAPDIIDLGALSDDAATNLAIVMQVAEEHLNIPPMLDEEDIELMMSNPRALTKVVQLYVAMLKEQLTQVLPAQRAAEAAAAEAAAQKAQVAAAGAELLGNALAESETHGVDVGGNDDPPPDYTSDEEDEDEDDAPPLPPPRASAVAVNAVQVPPNASTVAAPAAPVPPPRVPARAPVRASARVPARAVARVAVEPPRVSARVIGSADARVLSSTTARVVAYNPNAKNVRHVAQVAGQQEQYAGYPVPSQTTTTTTTTSMQYANPSASVRVQATAAMGPATYMRVRIPPGVIAGQSVDVPAPDGTRRRITIPRGYSAGMTFKLNFREAPLSPNQNVTMAGRQQQQQRQQAQIAVSQRAQVAVPQYTTAPQAKVYQGKVMPQAQVHAYGVPVQPQTQTTHVYHQPVTTTVYGGKAKGYKNKGYKNKGYKNKGYKNKGFKIGFGFKGFKFD